MPKRANQIETHRADDHNAKRSSPHERKDRVLTKGAPSMVGSIADAITIKDDDIFFLMQPDGDIPLRDNHGLGLYYHDCRFLKGYTLRIDDIAPQVLVADESRGFAAEFQLTNPDLREKSGKLIPKESLGIHWERVLDGKALLLHESLTMQNLGLEAVEFSLSLSFECGFEDIFDVRGLIDEKPGTLYAPLWAGDTLVFAYDGKDKVTRTLQVVFDKGGLSKHRFGASRTFHIDPRGRQTWEFRLRIIDSDSQVLPLKNRKKVFADATESAEKWVRERVRIDSDGALLNRIFNRSLRDLRMLRTRLREREFFAAGIPWFSTLFGRDSILSAYQILAYDSSMAEDTLRLLASLQGTRVDEWRDEEPGKIMHELRVGELSHLGEVPHNPYYGTIDATPLFLLLLHAHAQWTGDLALFNSLRDNVERALGWIDNYSGMQEHGYVSYQSASKKGLINQGWKDSGDAIVNADGSLAEPPISLIEVQGYVFAAWNRMAELFARVGEHERAADLRRKASALQSRAIRDFWLAGQKFAALALQAGGRPCGVVSSNAGQALWTGILTDEQSRHVADRLMAEDMFSGWGVRTLSNAESRFNPIGYHLGTVWPHDNALIAAGLRRYGHDEAAMRIFAGILGAASHFPNMRLPEVFAGFSRQDFKIPVHYPVACHPQAWAAGAFPFLLQTILGIEPDGFANRLHVRRPMLPSSIDRLALCGIRIGRGSVDLLFECQRGKTQCQVLNASQNIQVEFH